MSLYRVLVVDDEEDVRHGIIKKLIGRKMDF